MRSDSEDTKSAKCGLAGQLLALAEEEEEEEEEATRTCSAAWKMARWNTRGLAPPSKASQRATRSSGMQLSRTSSESWKVGWAAFKQGASRGGWPRGRRVSLARSRGQEDWTKSSGRAHEEELVSATVCAGEVVGTRGEGYGEGGLGRRVCSPPCCNHWGSQARHCFEANWTSPINAHTLSAFEVENESGASPSNPAPKKNTCTS